MHNLTQILLVSGVQCSDAILVPYCVVTPRVPVPSPSERTAALPSGFLPVHGVLPPEKLRVCVLTKSEPTVF